MFFEAQKETCKCPKQSIGVSDTEGEIHKTVVAGIRCTFKKIAGDFEHPTKETLMKVV